ncbi:MAG TPA: Flp pilus assembly protein CpaB [Devosia sp.]|nr:Flp pilus assembly protein CpaB [Devosia sp.]
MRPARLVLLFVALIAGGLAAYLATRGSGTPAPAVVQQVAAPKSAPGTKVLVAKAPIGVGQRLTPDVVDWQAWPGDAVRPEYITSDKSPDAPKDVAGTVARFEIFTGEPILDSKLVHSNQGVLSAVLDPGMRGVSIPVTAASGSGGFIMPNDRVDVVVTSGSGGAAVSQVVLSDVKVLAIGARLGQTGKTGDPDQGGDSSSGSSSGGSNNGPKVFDNSIATLELTPPQADALINASASGKVSLVLRSVADFDKGGDAGGSGANQNQTVKVIRFGRAQNVMAGGADQGQAAVAPAAYETPSEAPSVAPLTNPVAGVTVAPAIP